MEMKISSGDGTTHQSWRKKISITRKRTNTPWLWRNGWIYCKILRRRNIVGELLSLIPRRYVGTVPRNLSNRNLTVRRVPSGYYSRRNTVPVYGSLCWQLMSIGVQLRECSINSSSARRLGCLWKSITHKVLILYFYLRKWFEKTWASRTILLRSFSSLNGRCFMSWILWSTKIRGLWSIPRKMAPLRSFIKYEWISNKICVNPLEVPIVATVRSLFNPALREIN